MYLFQGGSSVSLRSLSLPVAIDSQGAPSLSAWRPFQPRMVSRLQVRGSVFRGAGASCSFVVTYFLWSWLLLEEPLTLALVQCSNEHTTLSAYWGHHPPTASTPAVYICLLGLTSGSHCSEGMIFSPYPALVMWLSRASLLRFLSWSCFSEC